MLKSIFEFPFHIIKWRKKIGLLGAINLKFIDLLSAGKKRQLKFELFGEKVSVFLRSSTTDIIVFQQIFIQRAYNVNIPFIPNNILDAGANNGLSSLYFAKKFPASKIISVEPDVENFEMLTLNNSAEKNVFCLNSALWNEKRTIKITSETANKDAIAVTSDLDQTAIEINAYSINDILKMYNISGFDVVKMDIEGSEAKVFSNNIEWLKDVRILIIELHDWYDNECSKNVFKALINWGFYLLLSGENLICFRDYDDYMKSLNKM